MHDLQEMLAMSQNPQYQFILRLVRRWIKQTTAALSQPRPANPRVNPAHDVSESNEDLTQRYLTNSKEDLAGDYIPDSKEDLSGLFS